MKKIIKELIGILIFIIFFLYLSELWFKKNGWVLMTCYGKLPDGAQCDQHLSVLRGFKSFQECYETGLNISSEEGFECGRKCVNKGSYLVCEEICNIDGCN